MVWPNSEAYQGGEKKKKKEIGQDGERAMDGYRDHAHIVDTCERMFVNP